MGDGESVSVETIYEDGTYLDANPSWHEEDSAWKARHIVRMLHANRIEPRTVCEIGCGAGGILDCLADSFAPDVRFSGYEISPQALELCKSKERSNLHFFPADAFDDEGGFDLAMAIDVIEHVEDYYGFLRKLGTKGAFTILHIPLDLSVQSVLRSSRLLRDREAVGHIQYFTKETALATLREAGYEVVDCFYTASRLELGNLGWRASLMKLPRRLLFSLNQDFAARVLGGFSILVLAKASE